MSSHCQTLSEGILLQGTMGSIRFMPYTAGCIRIRYTLQPQFNDRESLMVQTRPTGEIPYSVEERPGTILFSTTQLVIEINHQTMAFTYRDQAENMLTKEPHQGGKTLEPVEVSVNIFDQPTNISTEQGADGVKVRAQNNQNTIKRQAYHAKLEFEWAED
jgi:alpha-D-xyloside xylohydrolase